MQQAIYGFRLSQMISVAAKLRLADLMRERPRRLRELAQASCTHEDSLYRLLRTLAGFGIFAEEEHRTFRLTPEAEFLRSDVPDALRVSAEVVGEPWMWRSWGSLLHSVQTGETAFDHIYGKDTWTYFGEDADASGLFNEFMEELSTPESWAIVEAFDFGGKTVVDVAGGQGALLSVILERHPTARGVLFNLPHVIDSAPKENSAGIEFVRGNFFESVPPGGDVYVLKNILHDWEDGRAKEILAKCRSAMTREARLLIIENLVYGPNEPCKGKGGDINMMVRNGGRNRTEAEFGDLLVASGFEIVRVIPTHGGPDLLKASVRL
ncbi:MAG: hypothetical protein M3Z36_01705 [Acidobacteriota bacterium]|nr:hypothetical protein [Acidobacteriota bacterium]